MTAVWQRELYAYFDWLKTHSELGESWAVGVSGGADSLALILLLYDWAKKNNIEITALTVQHGLRPEAEDEAQYVSELMAKFQIKHQVLYWKGEKPLTGIESAARQARYDLMYDWCQQNKIKSLLVAHHKRDQAETFIMRLQRGSGVDGLASMAPISRWRDLLVVRPLLQVVPEDLRLFLQNKKIAWVEDASNQCEDFLRVKIRKMLPELERYIGLTCERICNTALEMGRVRDYLEKQTRKFVDNHVVFIDDAVCFVSPSILLSLHEEIALRVLSYLIKRIGKFEYPPCLDEVERLWEVLKQDGFKGRTLGGCEIFYFQKKVWIISEIRNKSVLIKDKWAEFVIDNPKYAKMNLPYKARCVLFNLEINN